MHKIGQPGGFLGRLLRPSLNIGLPLMKNVLKLLASATDAAIQKKIFGSGMTTLIISNKEMDDIMKIVKSLKESGLLIKGVNETIQNEAKEQKGGILSMLLGTLGASLLGNKLTGERVKGPNSSKISGQGLMKAGEGKIRAGQNF